MQVIFFFPKKIKFWKKKKLDDTILKKKIYLYLISFKYISLKKTIEILSSCMQTN